MTIDNGLPIFAVTNSVQAMQEIVEIVSKRIHEVNKAFAAITTSLTTIPSKRVRHQHQLVMDEKLAQVEESNTGLSTAMFNISSLNQRLLISDRVLPDLQVLSNMCTHKGWLLSNHPRYPD